MFIEKIFKEMRNLIYITALILFTTCTACDLKFFNRESEPKSEFDKLPPITQTGEDTFGCLVNGKAMVSNYSSYATAIYQGGFVQISGRMSIGNFIQSVKFIIPDPFDINVGYQLGNNMKCRSEYRNYINESICYYENNDTYEGEIIFSKIDKINFIISGTFEFSTVNENCDTVRITDGRFDIPYSP